MPVDESESRGNQDDDYNIEHEPRLRAPIQGIPSMTKIKKGVHCIGAMCDQA